MQDTILDIGDGKTARAALASPAGQGPHGAIVVVHEWWGLNDEIKQQARRFADEGLLAMAVDLYDGRVTDDGARAFELSNEMKTADAIVIVRAAVRALAAMPSCNGKVGVTGFCLGGAITLAAAANVEGLSAALPFYGTPRDEFLHEGRLLAPVQGHYAKNDPFVSSTRVASIADKVAAAGGSFELFFYDAGHAFMRQGDPSAYHAESAALAWQRATAFLKARLA